jgi:hypothetical protein
LVEGQSAYLVMELVPGDDLATQHEANLGPFPLDRVLAWADQLLDALDYIHSQHPPLIHGDIKPQNLKLKADNQVVLLGLGHPQRTLTTDAAASESFQALEQLKDSHRDERSDLFALAATLYTLLTGVSPMPAVRRRIAIEQSQHDPLTMPSIINQQVPTAVGAALVRALALDPDQRPASATALRADLQQAVLSAPESVSSQNESRSPRRRWLGPAIAGAAAVVILLVVLMLRGIILGNPAIGQQPTSQPPTNVRTIATTIPPTSAVQTPTPIAPAVAATAPVVEATRPPSLQVSSMEPQEAFTGTLPLMLIVRGAALDQVRTARLIADERSPIDTTIQVVDAGQLTLYIAALPEPLNGAVSYRLEIDEQVLEAPTIILRDFIQRKQMMGVLAQYDYTGRAANDRTGTYTRMRVGPNVDSQPVGQLRNGDEVEILREDLLDWYQIRVRTSGDAAQIGTLGWIERWLVDNQSIPAIPAPWVFAGRVYSSPTDAAVQCGGSFESSIYGSVENSNGRGIAGATLRVSSADRRNNYTVRTRRDGIYTAPGLGCTTWIIRLIDVPGAPNGIQANPVTVRNLNGGRLTSAEVRFRLQR